MIVNAYTIISVIAYKNARYINNLIYLASLHSILLLI